MIGNTVGNIPWSALCPPKTKEMGRVNCKRCKESPCDISKQHKTDLRKADLKSSESKILSICSEISLWYLLKQHTRDSRTAGWQSSSRAQAVSCLEAARTWFSISRFKIVSTCPRASSPKTWGRSSLASTSDTQHTSFSMSRHDIVPDALYLRTERWSRDYPLLQSHMLLCVLKITGQPSLPITHASPCFVPDALYLQTKDGHRTFAQH